MSEPLTAAGESFGAVLERLWRARHTGKVVLHFQSGRPTVVEIPAVPTKIVLDRSADSSA